MPTALILLLQAAASTQPSSDPHDFDLRNVASRGDRSRLSRGCGSDDPAEIVVCGSRSAPNRYRVGGLTSEFEAEAPKVETQLMDGVTGDVHVERGELPNGMISNRVMLRAKIKF